MSVLVVAKAPLLNLQNESGRAEFALPPLGDVVLSPDDILSDDSIGLFLSGHHDQLLHGLYVNPITYVRYEGFFDDWHESTDKESVIDFDTRSRMCAEALRVGARAVDAVTTALRLRSEANVWTPTVLVQVWRDDEFIGSDLRDRGEVWDACEPHLGLDDSSASGFDLFPDPYKLRREQLARIAELAARIIANERPNLAIAIRRLNRAFDSPEPDECLVDLIIALEALFTANDEGHISKKLAYRTALYFGQKDHISEVVRRSYKLRSDIVHGRQTRESAEKAIDALAGVVRAMLQDALTEPSKFEMYWKESRKTGEPT